MSEIFAPASVGTQGPPVSFRGAYSSATTYAIGDAVSESGSSYISLVASNTGHDPASSPSQWGLLAAAGTNGTNGSNGAAGAAGPAGSAGSVIALASSVLPTPINLFNYATAQQNYITNSDGTIGYHAPGSIGGGPPWATNLMYCPGATQLLCNGTIADNGFGPGAYIQLFDANGNFLSVLPGMGSYHIDAGTVVTLPGTQVYVRLSLAGGMVFQGASTMICVGTTASPATIPGAFVSFAPYLSSTVDTNIATALATSKTYIKDGAAALCNFVLPLNGNLFNPAAAQAGYACANDGTVFATSYYSGAVTSSGMVFCPGATAFICNSPVMNDNFLSTGAVAIQLFDAAGVYLGNVPYAGPNYGSAYNVFTLPGTQSYIRFCFLGGGTYQGATPAYSMVYAGAAATLPAMGQHTPFTAYIGSPTINGNEKTTVKKASDLGCALNVLVATGLNSSGTAPTDDSGLLQAFLNTASATNPIKLILDGVAYLTSGLVVLGHTTIEGIGWDSGLYLAPNTNQNVITAGATGTAPFGGAAAGNYNITLPSRATSNIILRDFTVFANGANQSSDGFGTLIVNATNITLDNMNYLQAFYFAATFSNCSNVVVQGCNFTSGGTLHDGVHLDGPVEDIRISDCVFATGDDAIAVNCPEGYGGDISRVLVTNCIFDNSLTAMRIYTSLQAEAMPTNNLHTAREILVSNCTGRTQVCAFSLGINGPSGNQSLTNVDQIQDLLIENCDITSDTGNEGLGWILVSDAVGVIQARGCVMRAPQSTAPFVMFNGVSQAGQITLSDITILRNGDGSSTPALFDNTNAVSVGKLTVLGCKVVDQAGSSYTAIPNALVFGAALSELVIDSIEMDHFTALASSFSNVTVARGAGILGTGVQIADSVMDNNVLYLSSNDSGAPSIKVGGTAKRLTLA